MVTEGIVLGHKISSKGIEVDKAKVEVIEKLPPPSNVKGIRSFLGHAGFYRRFIKDFSKIAKPLSNLLVKDTPFEMSSECLQAFDVLKRSLISAPVIIAPDWTKDFELMCDASDYAIGAVLGQRREKVFHAIYYASNVLNEAQLNYATIEKEFLAIVYALEKFRSYLIGSKVIVYTGHAAIKYLLTKPDSKPRLIRKRQKESFGIVIILLMEGIIMGSEQLQKFFSQDFIGLHYSKMHIIMLGIVINVKGQELFQEGMRCRYKLTKVLKHYGVKHKVAAPYHPQTNGQVEVSNREIKRILEKTVAFSQKDWSRKLDDALWAYRTAMKTSMGLSPFQMVYGKTCHLPVEMEHKALWALKFLNFDPHEIQSKRRNQLLELEEMRLHAYDSSRIYKEKVKFYHDKKLIKRVFTPGQQVLLFNSRLKLFPGKLKSKWLGTFVLKHVYPNEAVELETIDKERNWVVNGQRLKHYLGGEVEQFSTVLMLVDP
ncbi:uncharacterized protein LOC106755122 [Vigna radiata var. radiata]|uniref:Uncharacterized protein LOC106755122 n=1 Tax=Vigna radiata var. radiata TaxID=3916 RepID=A0A1S3TG13_VIGRR|nr:uncharacterized protein LOC106755122 [Vigna radiata var. radiata]